VVGQGCQGGDLGGQYDTYAGGHGVGLRSNAEHLLSSLLSVMLEKQGSRAHKNAHVNVAKKPTQPNELHPPADTHKGRTGH
jgi:hypothetical protein